MAETKKYLGKGDIAAYSLGVFGLQFIVGLLSAYQAEFFAGVMGADFAAIGIAALVVKLISAAADPIVGNRVDRKQSKYGKLKPFMMYAVAPLLVLTVLLFVKVPFTGTALYIWFFIIFLLWNFAVTLGDVPSQAFSSVLTPDPNERTNVLTVANLLKSGGLAAAGTVLPLLCVVIPGGSRVFTENDDPISYREYLISAVFFAVIGVALFSLIFLFNKEKVPYKAETMTFKEMWRTLKENKPLMLVSLSFLFGFGRSIQTGIAVQASNVVFGTQGLAFVLGIGCGVGQLVSTALLPFLCRRFGEKNTFIALSLIGFVMSMASYFVGTAHYVPMVICLFFMGMQYTALFVMPSIFVADSVDYYEAQTGRRVEGAAFSVLTLLYKVTLAMSVALGMIMLSIAKYDPNAVEFSVHTKNIVYFAFAGMPGVFSLFAVFPMLKYPLSGKKKLEIAKLLEERRNLEKK